MTMKSTRPSYALAAIVSAVLLLSCSKQDPQRPAAGGGAQQPRLVEAVPAAVRPMERVVSVTGTLAAQEASMLSAKVPGRLVHLAVDIGSTVRKDDLVAQVEPRDYELRLQQAAAALAQARASLGLPLEGADDEVLPEGVSSVKEAKAVLDEAARTRERFEKLSQDAIASEAEQDAADANHAIALTRYDKALEDARVRMATLAERRAAHEVAKKQLADAAVRAPFDGAVQSRPASAGEFVATGTPIVELVKLDPLRLRLEVPERESAPVRIGQPVRLTVEGDATVHTGQIARLAPALTEEDRMLRVEADVPRQGALRPGLFARAQIVVNESEEALAVPASALVTFAGIQKVVVAENGKALEKAVTTGRRAAGWVEIVSGIAAGELVVLDPAGLRNGHPIAIAEKAAAAAAEAAPSGAGTDGH